MKILLLLLLSFLTFNAFSQKEMHMKNASGETELMKLYYLVILKPGENRLQDTATANKLFAGHRELLSKYMKEGKLIISGPVSEIKDMFGIYIYDVADKGTAAKLVEADPAVKAGRFSYEIISWWAPKGAIFK